MHCSANKPSVQSVCVQFLMAHATSAKVSIFSRPAIALFYRKNTIVNSLMWLFIRKLKVNEKNACKVVWNPLRAHDTINLTCDTGLMVRWDGMCLLSVRLSVLSALGSGGLSGRGNCEASSLVALVVGLRGGLWSLLRNISASRCLAANSSRCALRGIQNVCVLAERH